MQISTIENTFFIICRATFKLILNDIQVPKTIHVLKYYIPCVHTNVYAD